MKILVDMDNTLNDLSSEFFRRVTELGYPIDRSDNSYHIQSCIVGESKSSQSRIMASIFADPSFWTDMVIRPNAVASLKKIMRNNVLYIATIPWVEEHKKLKADWVKKNLADNGVDIAGIYFEKEKWGILADILIDDKPEFLQKFPKYTVKSNHPYNADVMTDFAFDDWSEVPKVIDSIHRQWRMCI
jgi:5'(3')-deoxyribonucleotidase